MLARLRQGYAALAWFTLLSGAWPGEVAGQASAATESTSIPVVRLDIASTTEVSGINEPFFTISTCLPEGKAFLTRMVGPKGDGDIEIISNDGKNVIRLNANKITDISKPFWFAFTANESSIYLLINGLTPQNKILTLRKPDGTTETQPAFTKQTYIARFRTDGSYAGSVPLDLPFTPMQFGAFAQGDFFFAGSMKDTDEPQAALVKSTGQFDRFLELPGDIHARSEMGQPADGALALPRKAKTYQDTLQFALGFSTVVPDGRNLLLVRPTPQSPVFSISPGGAVQHVAVEIPEGFRLYDLKAGRNQWIAIYTRPSQDPHIKGLESAVFGINKTTGRLMAQYVFPQNLGMALTCGDGLTFTLLTRESDKLQLIGLSQVQ